jgi:hypothetical protein
MITLVVFMVVGFEIGKLARAWYGHTTWCDTPAKLLAWLVLYTCLMRMAQEGLRRLDLGPIFAF